MEIPKNVLIIKPGALGDTLLTLPAVAALRRAWPDAGFHWVGYPAHLEWLKGTAYLDACLSIDSHLFCHLFDGLADEPLMELLSRYDYGIAWIRDPQSMAGAAFRRAFGNRCLVSSSFPAPGCGIHTGDHLLQTLRGIADPRVSAALSDAPTAALLRGIYSAGESPPGLAFPPLRVMIHPGSGDRHKCWPLERFQAVAETLQSQAKAEICWLLGPAESRMEEEMRRYCHRHSMELIIEPRLRELSQRLQETRVFLGNDSGVTHLSAALGVGTWVLFGPTDPKEWAPQGNHVHVFVPETPQRGPDGQRAQDGAGCVLQWINPGAVSKAILDAMGTGMINNPD